MRVVRSVVTVTTFRVEDLGDNRQAWLVRECEVWECGRWEVSWRGYISHDEAVCSEAFYERYGRRFGDGCFSGLVELAEEVAPSPGRS